MRVKVSIGDEHISICDWCQKRVTDNGEMLLGGSHDGGWFHVIRTPKSTALDELRKAAERDFCSFECLGMWVGDFETKRDHA